MCGSLRAVDCARRLRLAGWLHARRDHGGLRFADLRDASGVVQLVAERGEPAFDALGALGLESALSVVGRVLERTAERRNPALATGEVELAVESVDLLGACAPLPFAVAGEAEPGEEQRLRYRFLDLRRERMHQNLLLRARVVEHLRRAMCEAGFVEVQTPILTASSPEGARDFLVPSRRYPGEGYALPQAPQIFKQLLMVGGIDRYFQIAPCFRDEDARADRSPGEFYQLDCELAFATEEDVFAALEPVMAGTFARFSDANVTAPPFPRIPWDEAMTRYGSDKPDLRNPLAWQDVTDLFTGGSSRLLSEAIGRGARARSLTLPGVAGRPRSFFDRLVERARELGAPGLAWGIFAEPPRGPLLKPLAQGECRALAARLGAGPGDAALLVCDAPESLAPVAAALRDELGRELGLLEPDAFRLCWITDFPMYERDPESGAIAFSHNPFSMPKGGLVALAGDPLAVRAHQYDLVCNGVELSSGAIRNHRTDVMLAAFALAGYGPDAVRARFGALYEAFRYGAPPHGGIAPGIDRIVMLVAGAANIRDVIAFPLAQNARDLLMGAPSPIDPAKLRELGLALRR